MAEFELVLRHLSVFVAVAKHLSFRKAAEELGVSQPVLSRSIAQMEDKLGLKLFNRTTRVVTLTEPGQVLFTEVSRGFNQIASGIRAARLTAEGHAGTLAIGYSTLAAHGPLTELIVQFNTIEPDVHTELHLRSSLEQLRDLDLGALDCGFLLSAACSGAHHSFEVYQERMVVLVARSHPLATMSAVELQQLRNEKAVFGRERRWATFRNVAFGICLRAGFLPTVVDEADEVTILLRQVALCKGITFFAASVREILPPDVIALPIIDTYAHFGISLVWRREQKQPILQRFVDFVLSKHSDFRLTDQEFFTPIRASNVSSQ